VTTAQRFGDIVYSNITHGEYVNVAVGATTLADLINRKAWNNYCNPSRKYSLFFFQGGINDYYFLGSDMTTIYNRMVTIAQAAKAAGCAVLVATMEDNWAVPLSDRVTLNNNIRANSTDWTVVDWGGNANIGCEGTGTCHSNTTYFLDGVHFAVGGHAVAATVLQAVVNGLGWN
jgi:lysophospholipase L1-like esterase